MSSPSLAWLPEPSRPESSSVSSWSSAGSTTGGAFSALTAACELVRRPACPADAGAAVAMVVCNCKKGNGGAPGVAPSVHPVAAMERSLTKAGSAKVASGSVGSVWRVRGTPCTTIARPRVAASSHDQITRTTPDDALGGVFPWSAPNQSVPPWVPCTRGLIRGHDGHLGVLGGPYAGASTTFRRSLAGATVAVRPPPRPGFLLRAKKL